MCTIEDLAYIRSARIADLCRSKDIYTVFILSRKKIIGIFDHLSIWTLSLTLNYFTKIRHSKVWISKLFRWGILRILSAGALKFFFFWMGSAYWDGPYTSLKPEAAIIRGRGGRPPPWKKGPPWKIWEQDQKAGRRLLVLIDKPVHFINSTRMISAWSPTRSIILIDNLK